MKTSNCSNMKAQLEKFSIALFNAKKDHKTRAEVEAHEKLFACQSCKNYGAENFQFLTVFCGGKQYVCDNCSGTIVVPFV